MTRLIHIVVAQISHVSRLLTRVSAEIHGWADTQHSQGHSDECERYHEVARIIESASAQLYQVHRLLGRDIDLKDTEPHLRIVRQPGEPGDE